MKSAACALAIMCICASANPARAEPGGTSGVTSPRIEEGEVELEARTAYFDGGELDDSWNHRAILGYAPTDWWAAALNLRAGQPADESGELTTIGLESRFDFTATRDWPVHLGALAEYKFGVNDAEDEIELKLLAEGRMGPIEARLNLIAAGVVEDDVEWSPEYAARAMWDLSEAIALGLEAYGEPEEASHYIGPRATMRLGPATLALGYLAGLDEARADSQFRLGIEVSP